ncbi:MAG: hypothetical protein COA42_22500 [Alteromonadaceae bacterium]|nr:MAG: hypothetical protein COA42_22500 [Alteromonadaceae bacterium]
MSNALISIKPKHVANIISGKKTVELRTRSLNLPTGSKLWIYSTLPTGKVEVSTTIAFIETKPPAYIWKKHKDQICISKSEFDDYTNGRSQVTVIGLSDVKLVKKDLCLKTLRTFDTSFTPPQFFMKLTADKKIYSAFS